MWIINKHLRAKHLPEDGVRWVFQIPFQDESETYPLEACPHYHLHPFVRIKPQLSSRGSPSMIYRGRGPNRNVIHGVLLKIYDLIFKFRNKSSILDLLFLTVPISACHCSRSELPIFSKFDFLQFLLAPSCRSKIVICFRMLFKSDLRILLLNSGDPQSSLARFLNSDMQRSPKFTSAAALPRSAPIPVPLQSECVKERPNRRNCGLHGTTRTASSRMVFAEMDNADLV